PARTGRRARRTRRARRRRGASPFVRGRWQDASRVRRTLLGSGNVRRGWTSTRLGAPTWRFLRFPAPGEPGPEREGERAARSSPEVERSGLLVENGTHTGAARSSMHGPPTV